MPRSALICAGLLTILTTLAPGAHALDEEECAAGACAGVASVGSCDSQGVTVAQVLVPDAGLLVLAGAGCTSTFSSMGARVEVLPDGAPIARIDVAWFGGEDAACNAGVAGFVQVPGTLVPVVFTPGCVAGPPPAVPPPGGLLP